MKNEFQSTIRRMQMKHINILFLSFLLCACWCRTYADVSNWNYYWESSFQYELDEEGTGYVLTWASPDVTGNVYLPETIYGSPVTGIGPQLFENFVGLTAIRMPSTVVRIGVGAFRNCTNLSEIDNADGVMSIEAGAFENCENLVSLNWYGYFDNLTNIEDRAFFNCSKLQEINFSDSLISIGASTFEGCASLNVSSLGNIKDIPERAFYGCTSIYGSGLSLDNVTNIADYAFGQADYTYGCCGGVTIPVTVKRLGYHSLYLFSHIDFLGRTICNGEPLYRSDTTFYPNAYRYYSINAKYRSFYIPVLGECVAETRDDTNPRQLTVRLISCQMRANNPTLMDIKYVVSCLDETVDTRILAYVNAGYSRSFGNVVRPETFLDGAQIGDDATCNVTNTLTWNVGADVKTDLAKLRIEILARTKGSPLMTLDFVTIPATSSHKALKVSVNEIKQADYLDALFWLYADHDSALTLVNGILYANGVAVAQDEYLSTFVKKEPISNYIATYRKFCTAAAADYLFSRMGYKLLTGDAKDYASKCLNRPFQVGAVGDSASYWNYSYQEYAYIYLEQ